MRDYDTGNWFNYHYRPFYYGVQYVQK